MKILIFGANGQTGRCLTPLLKEHELVTPGSQQVDFAQPGNLSTCIQQTDADYVINLAAYTAVDKAESEPEQAAAINTLAVAEIAEACRENFTPLLHVSTDFVFDGSVAIPRSTGDVCAPLGVYGATKYQGEQAVLSQHPEQSIILRTAWVYSDHGSNFLLSMLRLMNARPELNIVTDQVGTPTSAYSLAKIITRFLDGRHKGIFHWTDAGVASWYDFAVAIAEEGQLRGLVPKEIIINPIPSSDYPTPAKRPAYSVLDKSETYAAVEADKVHWRNELRDVMDRLQ